MSGMLANTPMPGYTMVKDHGVTGNVGQNMMPVQQPPMPPGTIAGGFPGMPGYNPPGGFLPGGGPGGLPTMPIQQPPTLQHGINQGNLPPVLYGGNPPGVPIQSPVSYPGGNMNGRLPGMPIGGMPPIHGGPIVYPTPVSGAGGRLGLR